VIAYINVSIRLLLASLNKQCNENQIAQVNSTIATIPLIVAETIYLFLC